MATDSDIPPPGEGISLAINELAMSWYFRDWAEKNLPAFEVVETSGTRTSVKNESVGGAANSAHLHGLARDFVLKQDGQIIPSDRLRLVYENFVKPTWPGYSVFEGDHIHVNLSREATRWAKLAAGALVGFVGFKLLRKVWGSI